MFFFKVGAHLADATDHIKKRAKQRAALALLRKASLGQA